MKYVAYILIFVCWFGTSHQAVADDVTLTLLVEENYPHASLNAKTGKLEGIEVDIINDLMSRAGIAYTMTITPWNRAYRRAQLEGNTCVFPINYTPERVTLFQWITPTQTGDWAIFQRPDSDISIKRIEDLRSYIVVAKAGIQAIEQLQSITGKRILAAGTDVAAAQLLHRGRADLLVSGIRNSEMAAQKAGLPIPKIAFNWKAAQFGLACSHNTDDTVINALRSANEARLARLDEN